jgi:hypothetical protein
MAVVLKSPKLIQKKIVTIWIYVVVSPLRTEQVGTSSQQKECMSNSKEYEVQELNARSAYKQKSGA